MADRASSATVPPPAELERPVWKLRAVGQPQVQVNGQAVGWSARSAEELLWFLHAHPDGCYRHDILRRLWQLDDTPSAANRFRVALHRLRSTLGSSEAVTEQHGRYTLHPELLSASDTYALQQALLAARADHAQPQQPHSQQQRQLQQALSAAWGNYLPHLTGDWLEEARGQHAALVVQAQLCLAMLHCAAHECQLATAALSKAAQMDPLMSEEYHQRLMTCLAMTQSKYSAIEHYRRYRYFLRHEVGDTPMQDTVELAERLKQGHTGCPRAACAAMQENQAEEAGGSASE